MRLSTLGLFLVALLLGACANEMEDTLPAVGDPCPNNEPTNNRCTGGDTPSLYSCIGTPTYTLETCVAICAPQTVAGCGPGTAGHDTCLCR